MSQMTQAEQLERKYNEARRTVELLEQYKLLDVLKEVQEGE